MGIPTFDIKYYFLGESRWDPYALMGFGLYYMTEGSVNNGTKAFGIGANLGIGCDYFITERFSVGLGATFRAIAFIESISGAHTGSSIFPFTAYGNFGYHF
jgi:outer membrane protein W